MSTVETHGPIFDGEWEPAMGDLMSDLVDELSGHALDAWRGNLNSRIRVNRGRYVSRPHITRTSRLAADLDDSRSVYGPWLEGTGSRNAPVTRFPGYHSAEDAAAEVNALAAELVAPRVEVFVREMNA